MRPAVALCVCLGLAAAGRAEEPPSSPYTLRWSFVADDVSAIEIDRGDLSKGRFATPYELVKYLGGLKPDKAKKPRLDHAGPPARELRVEQRGPDGELRTTLRYVASLAVWRQRLGEPMVERLEDEFDAHLRMVLPRKVQPAHPGAPEEKK